MNNQLAVRLDDKEGYAEILRTTLLAMPEITAMFCVRHTGKKSKNTHYHLAIRMNMRTDTFMSRFKNLFTKGAGNGHHSRKAWDGEDKYIQYMLHEFNESNYQDGIVVNQTKACSFHPAKPMYSDEQLNILLKKSMKIVEDIKDNTPIKVCQTLIQKYVSNNNYDVRKPTIFRDIMLHYIRQGTFLPNKFQSLRYISYIQYQVALALDQKSGSEININRFIDFMYQDL